MRTPIKGAYEDFDQMSREDDNEGYIEALYGAHKHLIETLSVGPRSAKSLFDDYATHNVLGNELMKEAGGKTCWKSIDFDSFLSHLKSVDIYDVRLDKDGNLCVGLKTEFRGAENAMNHVKGLFETESGNKFKD